MGIGDIHHLVELLQPGLGWLTDLWPGAMLLAQQFKDTLGSDVQNAWANFIDSGQAWALLIGVVLGYMMRLFTSY